MTLEPEDSLCRFIVIAAICLPPLLVGVTAYALAAKVEKKMTAIIVFVTGIFASLIVAPLINFNAKSCYIDGSDEYFLPLISVGSTIFVLIAINITKVIVFFKAKLRD